MATPSKKDPLKAASVNPPTAKQAVEKLSDDAGIDRFSIKSKKSKKTLIAQLAAAKKRYDKALKAYYRVRRKYTAALSSSASATDLEELEASIEKAKATKIERKSKLEQLQRIVHHYFTNRGRRSG